MRSVFNMKQRSAYRAMNQLGLADLFYAYYCATRKSRDEIREFQKLHQGKRCFILGGGPSLKELDPSPMKDEVTFGVNGIFLIFDWLEFEPTYYAVEDFLVYEDRFYDIKDRVRRSTCFFPQQFDCHGFRGPNHRFFTALYEFGESKPWPRFSKDPSRQMWIGGTVTYICMQLAYYMGFQEVYLVGMDHNYSKPDHLSTLGNDWTSHGEDPNHFHPDYFGKGYRWHDPQTERMEKAYAAAKKAFERDGRKIFNASIGGKLEVFERVDYKSLF
jgi:hypothetical protein